MSEMDFGNLRLWLDAHLMFASPIQPGDPRFVIAQEMLGIIAKAKASLLPSADSTANYVQNREIVEQLAILREKAEKIADF